MQKQNDIKISVIIVNWNGSKWLKKCLDSLCVQTCKKFEIIFVDNSSVDNSVEFMRANYPDVEILISDNKGYGHACNVGVNSARGDFLMFFNEDMHVSKYFIHKYLSFFESMSYAEQLKMGTIGCRIDNYDKTASVQGDHIGLSIDFMAVPVVNRNLNKFFYNSGCPLFIKKSTFIAIGGFCENIFLYGEDLDLCWRMNIYGYKHYFIKDVSIYHFGGGVTGQFSPQKLSQYIRGENICMINNYSLPFLFVSLGASSMFYMLLFTGYIFSCKIKYAKAIIDSYIDLVSDIKPVVSFRKKVQIQRKVPDFKIISVICFISSRLKNVLIKN